MQQRSSNLAVMDSEHCKPPYSSDHVNGSNISSLSCCRDSKQLLPFGFAEQCAPHKVETLYMSYIYITLDDNYQIPFTLFLVRMCK